MEKKRVTLREIADATGFTINTVSRAIKNQSVISESTRKLIQAKARELGYMPNRAATALRLGRTHTIALIVGYLVNPFFGMIFEHVSHAAEEMGYTLILFSSHEDDASEAKAIQAAIAYGVDGILLVPCQKSNASLLCLQESGTPLVLLAREFPNEPIDCALCDEEQGGYLAARHLLSVGHHKLAYVYEDDAIYSITRRRAGFMRAVREQGLPESDVRTLRMLDKNGWLDAPYIARQSAALYREEGFTGFVVFCDMRAWHIIAELRKLDVFVGRDIGVVGFDNIDAIAPSPLPLCSVGSDYARMCREALALLDSRVKGDSSAPHRLVYPAKVICRESCNGDEGDVGRPLL